MITCNGHTISRSALIDAMRRDLARSINRQYSDPAQRATITNGAVRDAVSNAISVEYDDIIVVAKGTPALPGDGDIYNYSNSATLYRRVYHRPGASRAYVIVPARVIKEVIL